MRYLCALAALALWVSGSATAATVSVQLVGDNSGCANGTSNNTNESSVCSQNGSATVDDWGAAWTTQGGTSTPFNGVGSASTTFTIDAKVAADDGGADVGQGGDRWIQAGLDFDLLVTVDVNTATAAWTLDLSQSVLGLFGLNGDGALSAVGTQNNGSGEISPVLVTVDGNPFNLSATPSSFSSNPSNGSSASQQFSGSRVDVGVLSGVGDATFNVHISFDLEAFSNDGCSGFICSSASGGEEAAVLFGLNSGVIDQDVDDYGFWGRPSGPDGYTSTWTLVVPEPGTAVLLGLGLAALAGVARRP